jgi:hypothetical protein
VGAGADALAERAALEGQAAAAAGGREDPGADEERAHERGPEEEVERDERSLHAGYIGGEGRSVHPFASIDVVSWLYIALLALAVAVVAGAEWPRFEGRFGAETRRRRERARRKESFRVVRDDTDDFAASVERDLANLPTIDETERRRR